MIDPNKQTKSYKRILLYPIRTFRSQIHHYKYSSIKKKKKKKSKQSLPLRSERLRVSSSRSGQPCLPSKVGRRSP
ncbi:hypothetical protein QJS04_geneDACA006402 [Acorus gramineus]|uniref:Uncharacterized protein n=1 Tax=Acorus gramineus TaxID=55184 RepID=A0AAV9AZ02_ACOGR|nr:hypothetical protein QJS04_geneDACA006402 [Acorus gramineus]